jgi:hypothetical protein
MMALRNPILGVLLVMAFVACKDDNAVPTDPGLSYFPLKVGSWIEYQVDSMWQDDILAIRDSVSYRLRSQVIETYTDPAGRAAHRILRYVRNEEEEWQVRDVWTATADTRFAEMTEENIRRLKLSFPVRSARTWDINVYNTERLLDVAFRDVDKPWSTGSLVFDSTVVVRNVLGPNAIERRDFEERYARHVGLIEKRVWETNTQFNSSTQQFVVRGFKYSMVAVAYGTE